MANKPCPDFRKLEHGRLIYMFEQGTIGDKQLRQWLDAYDL